MTPNSPFQITASQGTKIYFYYTYSYPGQGQHNNSANKDSYVIGSCSAITTVEEVADASQALRYYPNPVNDILTIEYGLANTQMLLYDLRGKLLYSRPMNVGKTEIDMSAYPSGVYFVRLANEKESTSFKVVR